MKRNPAREQGFTLIELLVVIAIIAIIAGFLVPTLMTGREEAYKAQCMNQLKQIYAFAMSYADKRGTRAFPIAPGATKTVSPRAHDSLNELISFDSEGLDPKFFRCPSCPGLPAEADDEGKFVLDETTCDYAWIGKVTKNTATGKVLGSDKYINGFKDSDNPDDDHSGHKKGMNVLKTDGSITFLLESDPVLDNDEKLPKGVVR
jgi:prepilin-type N-terminal cleavage/methylation domain-containing protein